MQMRVSALLVAGLLANVFSNATQAADGVLLRLKYAKGTKRYSQSSSETRMTQKIMGMELKTSFDADVTTETEVVESKSGEFLLQQRNLKYIMKAELPIIGKYEYDSTSSDNESSGALSSILTPVNDAISGIVAKITVTDRGEVKKVEGVHEALKGAVEQHPEAAQFTAGMHSEKGAKNRYDEDFIDLPEKPVNEGDSWTKKIETDIDGVGSVTGTVTYKYEGIVEEGGKKLHKIAITTETKVDVNQKANGATVTGTMEVSESSGKLLFDAEKGAVVSRNIEVKIGGTLTIDVNGQTITLEQSQTQKSSTKLLDKKPS